jgi:hypothetical protein
MAHLLKNSEAFSAELAKLAEFARKKSPPEETVAPEALVVHKVTTLHEFSR